MSEREVIPNCDEHELQDIQLEEKENYGGGTPPAEAPKLSIDERLMESMYRRVFEEDKVSAIYVQIYQRGAAKKGRSEITIHLQMYSVAKRVQKFTIGLSNRKTFMRGCPVSKHTKKQRAFWDFYVGVLRYIPQRMNSFKLGHWRLKDEKVKGLGTVTMVNRAAAAQETSVGFYVRLFLESFIIPINCVRLQNPKKMESGDMFLAEGSWHIGQPMAFDAKLTDEGMLDLTKYMLPDGRIWVDVDEELFKQCWDVSLEKAKERAKDKE
jgi:hypothetical protein